MEKKKAWHWHHLFERNRKHQAWSSADCYLILYLYSLLNNNLTRFWAPFFFVFLIIVYRIVVHTIIVDFHWTAVRWSLSLSCRTADAQLCAHASSPRTRLRYGMWFAPGQTAARFVCEVRWVAPLWAGLHLDAGVRAAVWAPEVVVPSRAASNGRTFLSVCLELIRKKEFPKIIFLK